jgi:chaperonin GroES
MLLDAGHYNALPAGFIGGQDLRIKPGVMRLAPGEFKTVNQRGDDIRKGIVHLNMPAPSPVLFELLGLLIEMGKDIASAKDITSEQARSMTATTTMALVDQGERIFSVSFKRVYRSLCKEFKLLFNAIRMMDPGKYTEFFDTQVDLQADFNPDDMAVTPVADPKAVTNTQKAAKAQFLYEAAQSGLLNPHAAMARVLEAMNIEDIEELVPQPNPQAQALEEMQLVDVQLSLKLKAAEIDMKLAQTAKAMAEAEAEDEMKDIRQYREALEAMKDEAEIERSRLESMAIRSGDGEDTKGAE